MTKRDVEQAFDSGDVEERRRAVARLRSAGEDLPAPVLLRALGDDDWRVRKEAALAAVALSPSPTVLDALLTVLEPGDNVGLRNSVVDVLAGYGVHAIGPLASVVAQLDADGRKLVVDALARGARPEALPVLEGLLADDDPNVRVAAVEAVAAIGDGCAEEAIALLDAALDSSDHLQQLAALDGLNRLAAVVPWANLEPLLDDSILVPAVVVAAGRSGAAEAVPAIAALLERSRGRLWEDTLEAVLQLAQSSPAAHAEARRALSGATSEQRARVLEAARREDGPLAARRLGLLAGGLMGGEDAATVAVEALADDDTAEDAESVLAGLGSIAVSALVTGTRMANARQRAACVELLAPLIAFEPEARRAIWAALDDQSAPVSAAALETLAAAGDVDALEAAARSIAPSVSPTLHHAAHRALVTLARRHPDRARDLARSLTPESAEAEAAIAVIEALGPPVRGEPPADVEFLSATASSEHPSVRRAALEALAVLGGPEALAPIALALTDEESEVRLAAVRALGRLRDGAGTALGFEALSALLVRGDDAELAAAAARALGGMSDPRTEPVLREAARGQPRVAVAALQALATLPAALRNDVVVAAIAHADTEVVKAALRALAAEGDATAAGHLAVGLDHVSRDVRRLAAELLGRVGVPVALGALRGRLTIESDPVIRDVIAKAILELESSGGRRLTAPPPSMRGGRRPR